MQIGVIITLACLVLPWTIILPPVRDACDAPLGSTRLCPRHPRAQLLRSLRLGGFVVAATPQLRRKQHLPPCHAPLQSPAIWLAAVVFSFGEAFAMVMVGSTLSMAPPFLLVRHKVGGPLLRFLQRCVCCRAAGVHASQQRQQDE